MVTGTTEKPTQATGKEQSFPEGRTAPDKGLEVGKEGGAEKTYSQSELDALLGKSGQRIKANLETVTTERDTLKTQMGTLTDEITEAKEKIDSLTKDIEAMSEDDPDKHGMVKRRKELEAEVKATKAERAAIAEDKAEMDKWKRDQRVYKVADEYVTASGEAIDFDEFKERADRFKLSEEEELEALAETMGFKIKTEAPEVIPASPVLLVDTSKTLGGGKTDSQIIKEYAENPHNADAKKAYAEYLRKKGKNR